MLQWSQRKQRPSSAPWSKAAQGQTISIDDQPGSPAAGRGKIPAHSTKAAGRRRCLSPVKTGTSRNHRQSVPPEGNLIRLFPAGAMNTWGSRFPLHPTKTGLKPIVTEGVRETIRGHQVQKRLRIEGFRRQDAGVLPSTLG